MSELDKGLVTSIITFICLFVFGYFTGDTIGKSEVIGFATALAGIIVWYYNEKHNSSLVSEDIEHTSVVETEADLINEEYYECQEDEV